MLKNWRPITLLNVDYKIAAFALSNRLHKVLLKVISPQQSGYVKKRYIGNNIRLIEDIIEYTNRENKKGAAIFCDFEKAFDTVEINFVITALKHFGFGNSFQKWVSAF